MWGVGGGGFPNRYPISYLSGGRFYTTRNIITMSSCVIYIYVKVIQFNFQFTPRCISLSHSVYIFGVSYPFNIFEYISFLYSDISVIKVLCEGSKVPKKRRSGGCLEGGWIFALHQNKHYHYGLTYTIMMLN